MSFCFICAEPNPCDDHKNIVQARRDELSAANKAIVAMADALEKVSMGTAWFTPDEMTDIATLELRLHAPAIEKAKDKEGQVK